MSCARLSEFGEEADMVISGWCPRFARATAMSNCGGRQTPSCPCQTPTCKQQGSPTESALPSNRQRRTSKPRVRGESSRTFQRAAGSPWPRRSACTVLSTAACGFCLSRGGPGDDGDDIGTKTGLEAEAGGPMIGFEALALGDFSLKTGHFLFSSVEGSCACMNRG